MHVQEYLSLLCHGVVEGYSYNLRVCVQCHATYEPYKIGKESELFGFWGDKPMNGLEIAGVCCFCNPKSVWYFEKI